MKIQICRKFSKVNKLHAKLSEAFPDKTIIIKKCISMCKVCKSHPSAQIKGKKFKAKRISTLITKIEDR